MGGRMNKVFLCVALLFPAIAYVLVAVVGRPSYDTDYFEYIGWVISCGGELYRDIWDCKGPLLYYLYALGQFLFPSLCSGGTLLSLVLWEVVVLMIYRLSRSFGADKHAGACALLFVVFALGSGTWLWIGCQEIIAAFFALVALQLIGVENGGLDIRTDRSPVRIWGCVGLGACVAAAFMVKATCAAFGCAVFVFWCLQVFRSGNWRRALAQTGLSFAGFCAAFVGISYMCSGWSWERMLDASILYNIFDRGHAGVSWGSFWFMRAKEFLYGDIMWFLRFGWNYPFFVSLFALSFFLRTDGRVLFFRIWLAFELAVSVCSKGFFDHYLIVSAVPLTILFAQAAFRVPLAYTFFKLAVIMFFLSSFGRFLFYYARFCHEEHGQWSAIAGVTCDIPEKTRVAVCGCTNIHVMLRRWKLLNRNAYSAWMFWFFESSKRRSEEMLDDFERAVTSSENEWILSEGLMDDLKSYCDDRHSRLRDELGKYQIYRVIEKPSVYFYKRINAVRTQGRSENGATGN